MQCACAILPSVACPRSISFAHIISLHNLRTLSLYIICAHYLSTSFAHIISLHHLRTLSHKRHDFYEKKKKKFAERKMSILIFSATLAWEISHSKMSLARFYKWAQIFLWTWYSWFRASRYSSLKRPTGCNCVVQFIAPWLLYTFRAILLLIIRSF
jgi:hypothetical protein